MIIKMVLSHGNEDLSRFAALEDSLSNDWPSIDTHLHVYLAPLHFSLSHDLITLVKAGESFTDILSLTISSITNSSSPHGPRRPRAMDKLVTMLSKEKNISRKTFR